MSARRPGAVLTHVLVVSLLLLAVAVAVIRVLLQRNQASAKSLRQSELSINTEGLRHSISSCLGGAGYPSSASCQPTPAQGACVPPGVTAEFSGTPPACTFRLTVTK